MTDSLPGLFACVSGAHLTIDAQGWSAALELTAGPKLRLAALELGVSVFADLHGRTFEVRNVGLSTMLSSSDNVSVSAAGNTLECQFDAQNPKPEIPAWLVGTARGDEKGATVFEAKLPTGQTLQLVAAKKR